MGRATFEHMAAYLQMLLPKIALRGLAAIVILCHIAPSFSAMYDRPAFVGLNRLLPLDRSTDERKTSLCMSSSQQRVPFGRMPLKMDRKDGGADKIARPTGPGKIGNPNTPGGAGAGGERESEKGGAGVAVLTKPPETDKACISIILYHRFYFPSRIECVSRSLVSLIKHNETKTCAVIYVPF